MLENFKRNFSVNLVKAFGDQREVFFDRDEAFENYKECILGQKGGKKGRPAILFSVMGGKLSEGINFKDKLARAVFLVGLPYPNIKAPEIKVRMQYYSSVKKPVPVAEANNPNNPPTVTSFSGMDYYRSACLKVINQSVGRAVRHRADYAAVILVDKRYASQNVLSDMPQWVVKEKTVRDSLSGERGLREGLKEFFDKMRLKYPVE